MIDFEKEPQAQNEKKEQIEKNEFADYSDEELEKTIEDMAVYIMDREADIKRGKRDPGIGGNEWKPLLGTEEESIKKSLAIKDAAENELKKRQEQGEK